MIESFNRWMKRPENVLKYLGVMHMTVKRFPSYKHPGFVYSNAMKKRGSSAYDLWKSLNKIVSALCFPTNAFSYDISYPNFSIMVAWIVATDKGIVP